jgi:hypothetical protein
MEALQHPNHPLTVGLIIISNAKFVKIAIAKVFFCFFNLKDQIVIVQVEIYVIEKKLIFIKEIT